MRLSDVRQALTSALYYLGESPSLVEALRDEVKPIIESEGWSKAALDKMHKVDSFLKESQRLNTDFRAPSSSSVRVHPHPVPDGSSIAHPR